MDSLNTMTLGCAPEIYMGAKIIQEKYQINSHSCFNRRWAEGWCCWFDTLKMEPGVCLCSLLLHHPLQCFPGDPWRTAWRRGRQPPGVPESALDEEIAMRRISATTNTGAQIDAQAEDVWQTYHLYSCCTHPASPSQSSPGPCGIHSRTRWKF